jgi:FtsP/CotA-like multicopper oxidase with cupredoxin domain
MSTAALLTFDLVLLVLAAAGFFGAAVAATTGRPRLALAGAAGAAVASLARVGTIAGLAGAGWWFVQDKVTVTGPLLLAGLVAAAGRRNPVGYFAAGYAAVAGIVVTELFGYPATWSEGLIAAALVGAATLVTQRVTAPPGSTARAGLAVVLALGVVGAGLAFVPSNPVEETPVTAGPTVALAGLVGPQTPDPGGSIRTFALTAGTHESVLKSGTPVDAWTFNGQLPGPALTATQGDLVEVTLHNTDIADGVTLHWHGYDVPAGEDGVPGLTQDAVRPGGSFVYRFVARQAGTYWYHTHEVSDRGVRKGLFGTFVVTPRAPVDEEDLTIPVHTFQGRLAFGDHDAKWAVDVAPGRRVRLRIVNTDNGPHVFGLDGTPYTVTAVDGDDLSGPAPVTGTSLRLPAGGRYDVTFTMPGTGVALVAAGATASGLRLGAYPGTPPDPAAQPQLDLLRYGTPAATPFGAGSHFDDDFTMVLDRGLSLDGGLKYAYTVNGHAFPDIPTQVVREGDLVRMTVANRSGDTHPWHLHGHKVLVLARNGRRPQGSPLWMDTFDVRPGEVWQVAFKADNPGLWMNHCHNLAHAGQGMALHLAYAGVTSAFHGGHPG